MTLVVAAITLVLTILIIAVRVAFKELTQLSQQIDRQSARIRALEAAKESAPTVRV